MGEIMSIEDKKIMLMIYNLNYYDFIKFVKKQFCFYRGKGMWFVVFLRVGGVNGE